MRQRHCAQPRVAGPDAERGGRAERAPQPVAVGQLRPRAGRSSCPRCARRSRARRGRGCRAAARRRRRTRPAGRRRRSRSRPCAHAARRAWRAGRPAPRAAPSSRQPCRVSTNARRAGSAIADAIAGAHAERAEALGGERRGVVQLRVGQRAVVGAQRDRVGTGPRGTVKPGLDEHLVLRLVTDARKPGMPAPAGKDAGPKVCLWHIERAPPAKRRRSMRMVDRPVVRTLPGGDRRPGVRADCYETEH